jgi:hypothetical protein
MKIPPKEIVNLPANKLAEFHQSESFEELSRRYGKARLIFSKPVKAAPVTRKPRAKKPASGWVNARDRETRLKWEPKNPEIKVYIEKSIGPKTRNEWFIVGGCDYILKREFRRLEEAKQHVEVQYAKWRDGVAIDPETLAFPIGRNIQD